MLVLKPEMLPNKRLFTPAVRLLAVMGLFALSVTILAEPAYANCKRHIYNKSSYYWHFTIENSSYPNYVNFAIGPGETKSFWHNTGSGWRRVKLVRMDASGTWPNTNLIVRYDLGRWDKSDCYITHTPDYGQKELCKKSYWKQGKIVHKGCPVPQVVLNDPADGDIVLID
ncbi:MAG: hypothetical protein QM488_04505 [Rhizobiaceae bacterium]